MISKRTGFALAVLSVTVAAIPYDGFAQVAPATAPVQPAAAATGRQAAMITLASLGLKDGVAFSDLDGRSDMTFQVPIGDWLAGTRLLLPYRAWVARPTPRTLTILSGDMVLGQFPISGDGTINIAVPPTSIIAGSLPISLVYSGGLTPDRCSDGRLAADHLIFDKTGGLALDAAPGAVPPVAATIAMLGMTPAIVLPANPTAEQAAAALTIIEARGDAVLTNAGDAGGNVIRIEGTGAPALQSFGPSVLALGGRDPAGAARAALTGLALLPDAQTVDRLRVAAPRRDDVTLADLGASLSTVNVGKGHQWTVTLPAARIPGGGSINGLSIDVATVADGRADRLSAWLNGAMLGSTPISNSGITHLELRARKGMTNTINTIAVRIDRPAQGDCGDAHLAMPAQLLSSSRVILGDVEEIRDFHDFASASADGVTVVMPNPAMLPLAAKAVAALLGANVPVTVSYGAIPAKGPAIVIAQNPPPGTKLPLSLANGRVQLTNSESGEQLDVPQSPTDTVVQLLNGQGGPLLWIRPAQSGAIPATMWLDQGDVAIVNPAGTVRALSTSRSRLNAPTAVEPQSWWDRNAWIVYLAAGLAIGLGLLFWALRPSVKRAKPSQTG